MKKILNISIKETELGPVRCSAPESAGTVAKRAEHLAIAARSGADRRQVLKARRSKPSQETVQITFLLRSTKVA